MIELSFTMRTDDSVVLTVQRPDGSVTWQKHQGASARFFPFHDLAHFAVETVLGARDGFYGLLAAGWDISDTGGKGPRGSIPSEAILVEHLVGLFERERVGGAAPLREDEFNANLAMLAMAGQIADAPVLTQAQLDEVRGRIDELHREWSRQAFAGKTLKLVFDRPDFSELVRSSHERAHTISPIQRR